VSIDNLYLRLRNFERILMVLRAVDRENGSRPIELHNQLFVPIASLFRIIEKCFDMGWLSGGRPHFHITVLRLTDKGRALLDDIHPVYMPEVLRLEAEVVYKRLHGPDSVPLARHLGGGNRKKRVPEPASAGE
jgi:hypothetical protein